jgi:hypothetical protein
MKVSQETAMTLDELLARESIRLCLARYNIAGDGLRVDDFVSAFTEDGVLEFGGEQGGGASRFEGRAAIRGWMENWRDQPAAARAARRPSFVRHHLTTSLVEFTGPETAKARSYFAVYTDIGPDHAGCYNDLFRRTQGAWLIAQRRVRVEWHASESFFRSSG